MIWISYWGLRKEDAVTPYLFLLKLGPFALVTDHVTFKGLWVTHLDSGGRLMLIAIVFGKATM